MKTLIISLATATLCISAGGQEQAEETITAGKITFEDKMKLEIKLDGNAAQYADMLPRERKSVMALSFTEKETLYEEDNSTGNDLSIEEGQGMQIRMISSGGSKTYTDLTDCKVIQEREFMNRLFCVERALPATKWKMTSRQKEILGYRCFEAVATDSAGVQTVAWFAPSFTVHGGPALFSNLPGMVLEVNINDGAHTITATGIEAVDPADLKIVQPKEGKKVTEEEYNAIVAEKMKEMGMEQGQQGQSTEIRIVVR